MARSVARDFTINRRINRIIKDTDKRPTAIADKAGIRRDTFSRIIRSERPLYADEIQPICTAIGISVSELFHQEDSVSEQEDTAT